MQRSSRQLLEAFLGVEFHTQTLERIVALAANVVTLLAAPNVARIRLQVCGALTNGGSFASSHNPDLGIGMGAYNSAGEPLDYTLWDDFDDVTLALYATSTVAQNIYVREVILTGLGPDQVG